MKHMSLKIMGITLKVLLPENIKTKLLPNLNTKQQM